jgi:DNA-binding GntR family transcriptional regulator
MAKPSPLKAMQAYEAVKQEVLSGRLAPGEWIDVNAMASALAISITTVRLALYKLAGEELVEGHPRQGFFMRPLTESALQDLFAVREALQLIAIRFAQIGNSAALREAICQTEANPVAAIDGLFRDIAVFSGHDELSQWIERADNRLAFLRENGSRLLPDLRPDQEAMAALWIKGDLQGLEAHLLSFGQTLRQHIPEIAAQLRTKRHSGAVAS